MSDFSAIAFDKDGTLFDSERLYGKAFRLTCRDFNLPSDEAFRAQFSGLAVSAAMERLKERFGKATPPSEPFVQTWLSYYERLSAEQGLPYMPHARQAVLKAHAAGYPLALVTSDNHEAMLHCFDDDPELLRCFSVTVCVDDVQKPKPDPEPYTRAAAYLGVEPGQLLVVEDSLHGARAALAAGAKLVYYPSSGHIDPEVAARAYKVTDDLSRLEHWL